MQIVPPELMPVVIVPPPFQGPTQGRGRVEVSASTIRSALEAMTDTYPGFADLIWKDGALSKYVKIFHEGELIEGSALDREIGNGDELEVVAAIAGGWLAPKGAIP